MNQDVEINIEDIDKIISDIDRPIKRPGDHDGLENPAKKRIKDTDIDPSITNGDLDLQFEMALEQHHREMSQSPAPKQATEKAHEDPDHERSELAPQHLQNKSSDSTLHERHDTHTENDDAIDPEMSTKAAGHDNTLSSGSEAHQIHTELSLDSQPSQNVPTVIHQGVEVPADSELLNSNNAFVAYNELSSQLPSVPMTSNIHLTSLPLPIIAADYLPPRIQLLVNTLPTLDNLSTQLLRIFTIGPYQKIIDMVSNPETPQGAAFRDLTSMFEFSKKLYSEDEPFLAVDHIAPGMWKQGEKTPTIFKNREQSIESTLRKVNLSTFLLATLGMIEVGFFYLNESFLNIFCPLNNLDPVNSLSNLNDKNLQSNGINSIIGDKIGKLLKPQAVLYLGLKTQAYISAIEAGERSREEILQDILPDNLEDVLIDKRGTKFLTPTELDFIERCKSRKLILLTYKNNNELSEEYEWFNFLKELFDFVSKNMIFLVWGKKSRVGTATGGSSGVSSASASKAFLLDLSTNLDGSNHIANSTKPLPSDAPISEISNSYLPSEILEQQLHVKVSNGNNRTTTRRPWTREEEKALRHALELKGPHWSNILELFGAGGKISEALKNRNQGQLKDKARNWKMFFLKLGLPVPQYLQQVTGDLERDDKLKRAKRNAAAPIPKVN